MRRRALHFSRMADDSVVKAGLKPERPASDSVASLCKKLCSDVRDLVKVIDPSSRISHVSTQPDGSTLVRIAANGEMSECLKTSLRKRWPLSSVVMVENVAEGSLDLQVGFPSADDAWAMANERASAHIAAKLLRGTYKACLAAFAVSFFAMLGLHVPWQPQQVTHNGFG